MRQSLDAVLAQRDGLHQLPPKLETLYRQTADLASLKQIRLGFLILAGFNALLSIVDLAVLTHDADFALLMRSGTCGLFLMAWYLLGRGVRGWSLRLATLIPLVVQVVTVAAIGNLAAEPFSDRYYMAGGISIALINLFFLLSLRMARAQTLLALLIFGATVLWGSGSQRAVGNADMVLFPALIAAASLISVRRLELRNKKIFVLRQRDELRAQELQYTNDYLRTLSLSDGLTGVGNRRSFDLILENALTADPGVSSPFSLLLMDVDFFKGFNDSLGHSAGDRCLRTVAQVLLQCLPAAEDCVARYGGEEFAVILRNVDSTQATKVAERMRAAVEDLQIPHPKSELNGVVTISIGLSSWSTSQNNCDSAHLIEQADSALYKAKHEGRNRVGINPLACGHSTVEAAQRVTSF